MKSLIFIITYNIVLSYVGELNEQDKTNAVY